ncbi:Putative DNA helicase ino80 [Sparganum proliferum]
MDASNDVRGLEQRILAALDTSLLLNEIEELEEILGMPLSVSLSQNILGKSLGEEAWKRRSLTSAFLKSSGRPKPNLAVPSPCRNLAAMQSQVRLMAQWREEARKKIRKISSKERQRIIDSVRGYNFQDLLERTKPNGSSNSDTDAAEDDKGKNAQKNSHRFGCRYSDYCSDDYMDEEDQEDDLTRFVRRQREACSARVAAGRPSIRRMSPDSMRSAQLTAVETESIAAVGGGGQIISKQERLYRALIKKCVGKATRLRATIRRDKMLMARRAARDCARAVRQRVLQTQKPSRDPLNRARRLAREISAYWCLRGAGNESGVGVGAAGSAAPGHDNGLHDSAALGVAGATGPVESAAAARRRAERALAEQRKADLELLEARRQQRKLNFLLTQTELYAHFMAKKMNVVGGGGGGGGSSSNAEGIATSDVGIGNSGGGGGGGGDLVDDGQEPAACPEDSHSSPNDSPLLDPDTVQILRRLEVAVSPAVGEEGEVVTPASSALAKAAKEAADRLGVDDAEEYNADKLKTQALSRVTSAIQREQRMLSEFAPPLTTKSKPEAETATATEVTRPPSIFCGDLKAYQLRGLTWLLTLFDQGINGILADEMGLGKTIQTIAFLGSLAEKYNLWGPFLIVTPASTLHNWTQEFAKFMPAFRLVPYWGSPAERKVLRRFWSASHNVAGAETDAAAAGQNAAFAALGTAESPFHVVVTSYQVVLQDAKFINKTAWTYIVLDEAHAIKSTSSLRWRILLSFRCRNRLLLTGTPIQNAMRELWALLHFIMPTLFDSHDEFADWFSKDIESQAASGGGGAGGGGGGDSTTTSGTSPGMMDENQLSRLRLILKPFMLRRIKTEVEHEISDKTEVLIYCTLTSRQKVLYNRLKSKICIEDLNDGPGSFGSRAAANEATARLMNLVMQLRKVCNHPDLFDRRDVRFSCSTLRPYQLFGFWWLPKLLFDEGLLPGLTWRCLDRSGSIILDSAGCHKTEIILRHFLLLTPAYFMESFWHRQDSPETLSAELSSFERCFSAARLSGFRLGVSSTPPPNSNERLDWEDCPTCPATLLVGNPIMHCFREGQPPDPLSSGHLRSLCHVFECCQRRFRFEGIVGLHPMLQQQSQEAEEGCSPQQIRNLSTRLQYPDFVYNALLLPACVQPVTPFCSRPNILSVVENSIAGPGSIAVAMANATAATLRTVPMPPMIELVSPGYLIADSGKMKDLDRLLARLKREGHRVLIYSQMTKMINLLEELMIYRSYSYLRLDGSSRLSDRRDMVAQWQTDPRWFVFLLSTRAGGLGINLTAADTVIFYDSDWNPTVDQQAMDRAHRLGQTKAITVYRLISKDTIEGRMLQRAEEKRAMQRMVIAGGGQLTDSFVARPGAGVGGRGQEHLTQSDMVSLLLDDAELAKRLAQRRRMQPVRGRPSKMASQQQAAAAAAAAVSTPSASGSGQSSATPTHVPGEEKTDDAVSSEAATVGLPSTSNVDFILNRKRLAAWAERSRGRGRKSRLVE